MTSSSNSNLLYCPWREVIVVVLVLFGVINARAHVPVPDSVLDPKTPEEAWNVLRLAIDNSTRLLKENRLAEVADQVSLCAPALRFLPKAPTASLQLSRLVAVEAMQSSVAITSLAQAALAGDKATSESMLEALRGHLASLATAYENRVTKAEIYYCPMHPEFVSADLESHCDKCGMALLQRRIPYSFVYVPAGESSIRLSVSSDEPLKLGEICRAKVRLTWQEGTPVIPSDLLVMHTQPIHLLIVESGLIDYHHEHPTPTETPGEYSFSFKPMTKSGYRIFADLVPVMTGIQEYPWTDLPGVDAEVKEMPVKGLDAFSATTEGLNFTMALAGTPEGRVRAGQVCALQITLRDAVTGKPVNTLEPVMHAFAHLVGFYGDYHTVVHLHPLGVEIVDPTTHGGPTLEFKFYPPKAGFIRLYCQIQIGGQAIYCPFSVNVAP